MADINVSTRGREPRKSAAGHPVATDFDWLIYADATFAGLAILIPFPFLDALLEEYFRRRMPRDIARRHGRTLAPAVVREVNRNRGGSCLGSCVMMPLELVIYVVRNLYRTVLYILSVYDASEKLSFYWHRAFLLNYMIDRGHLDDMARAPIAAQAMHRALKTTQTSPLLNLAGELVAFARTHTRGLMRTIYRYIRREQETAEAKQTRASIAAQWAEFQDYLIGLADRYDAAYIAVEQEQQAAAAESPKP